MSPYYQGYLPGVLGSNNAFEFIVSGSSSPGLLSTDDVPTKYAVRPVQFLLIISKFIVRL